MKNSRAIQTGFCVCVITLLFLPKATAEQWLSIGPFGTPLLNNDVISGQTNVVAIDPHDANTLYIGAAEGGVWRTTNGGASWKALTDTQLVRNQPSGKPRGTLSIGALAIDPSNPRAIYAGTGEPHVACDTLFGPALGVFRSTDAGDSWTPMGMNLSQGVNAAMSTAIVNRILIIPGSPAFPPVNNKIVRPPGPTRKPAQVLAATNMGLLLYKEDGSDTWSRLTNGLPASGDAVDLVTDPFQHVLYVAFESQGIYKSTDMSGTQWTHLTNGLPSTGFGWIALAFGGRTGIGFSQPSPLVYAGINFNGQYRLFKTVNGGDAWTELPSPPTGPQIEFNDAIAVGSYDSNELYVGQVTLWRATDGGAKGGQNDYKASPPVTGNSWTDISCCQVDPNPTRRGMDLHADNHDIEFAPSGSFTPSPQQVQIVYVANDGGLAKGRIDFNGVITWESLTKGLAIGQNGTIALDPNDPFATASGVWHNGDILTLSNPAESVPMGGGDGFQAAIDAGSLILYVNCNAGFGGSICRNLPPAPFFTNVKSEAIWSDNDTVKHWSDPHRPGNLLRIQKSTGLLFRTTVANTATAAVLNTPDAWVVVDPGRAKTGNTSTMAFRSRLLEETPVYYLGTDTGQVWRGSPEAGWIKLAECGAKVNAIAPDLFQNERIFVVLKGTTSPGRIKEITRLANGSWDAKNIDAAFTPDLDVQNVVSVAVDPTVPAVEGTTIYVGTDQGLYRGHIDAAPFLNQTEVAHLIGPPVIGQSWTWRRSPGVPNVWVMDLKVHQNFQAQDRTGIVRAGTYGRGIFELSQFSPPGTIEKPPITLSVQAMLRDEDGAPSAVSATIPVVMKELRADRETPFEFPASHGAEVTLEAPKEIQQPEGTLAFMGWALPGNRPGRSNRITLKLNEASKATAYYEMEKRRPDPKARPLRVSLSTSARQVCELGFTHELELSWDTIDGQRPVTVRAEITYPDKHVENVELKSIEGSRPIPMNYPAGGTVSVKVTAEDFTKETTSAASVVKLQPCTK